MKRLAIIATHPVQYNAPWFKLLTQRQKLNVKVFYTWSQSQKGAKYDPDFGKVIEWDIPLLEGYDYEFIENVSTNPGSHHFKGIINPALNKTVHAWKPDAVLVVGWSFKSHLACMRYFTGKVPVLFRGDSTLLNEKPGLKRVIRRLVLTYVYSFVDHVLYVGANNKKYYLAHGLKESQLHLAPHAIDNDRFGAREYLEKAKLWRAALGIGDEKFVILYAGKLEERKNPMAVLDLAAQIVSNDYRFLVVGNGPLEQEMKARAANDKRIVFIDFQNQQAMPAVYRLGDALFMPSRSETWGLGANEAMACGLPVLLSSNVGGAVDLVNKNGVIFNLAAMDELKQYIEKLAGCRPCYEASRNASLEHIKTFSFTHIAETVEAICGV
ncbi:glycosyltransferase family 4 protein [Flavisolibacter ginsenosidimutans]|uniref:Glycosyltransferase family 4 protein n=1 Tax=Flavisolibacter ginsenosidimutans TaxID=661481 RepID=A0A5B8UF17_9BACT|nr:glycosyltransferase family 4 protein [Flavisolibacter ginsenosidimutans]QEC54896.1 glycosyltransferase family 4 protein [Flavisolibacter ginsenosidimutans]